MAINSNNQICVGGKSSSSDLVSNTNTPNAFISYYTSSFSVLWTKQLPDEYLDISCVAFDISDDSKVFVASKKDSGGPLTPTLILKFSSTGSLLA